MATQYTAGLTTGQVLTAATMNEIGAAWETWTPTYSATVGAFTTITTNLARYARIQKIVVARIDATITAIGTAGGNMQFTIPITAKDARAIGVIREINAVGWMGSIDLVNTTTGQLVFYANQNTSVNTYRYTGTIVYEAA
jgi:hypothetical protein